MRLGAVDGPRIDLDICGYEFASGRPGQDRDGWDEDWLVVRGRVQLSDGTAWEFRDPALTTPEAGELLEWLQQEAPVPAPSVGTVVGGAGAADGDWPWEAGATAGHWLAFTEPNLAFVRAAGPDGLVLLVGLALECAAPVPQGGVQRGDDDGSAWSLLQVPWSSGAGARAAADWGRQLGEHPPR